MATEPLPFIAQEHYDAIRRVAPDLPASYAEWLQLIEQKRQERSRVHPVQLVPVLPVEFVAYCIKRNLKGSIRTLMLFAIDTAEGRDDTGQDAGPLKQRH